MGIFQKIKSVFADDEQDRPLDTQSLKLPVNPEPDTIELDYLHNFTTLQYGDTSGLNVRQLIKTYRNIAAYYEVEDAIDEIVNDCVVVNKGKDTVDVDIDKRSGIQPATMKKIKEAFQDILGVMDFDYQGDEWFKRWYVDGRIYIQKIYSKKEGSEKKTEDGFTINEKEGIIGYQLLDPLHIQRIKVKDERGHDRVYFFYHNDDINKNKFSNLRTHKHGDRVGYLIPEDHIIFVPSGLIDTETNIYLSYLHRAIKPLNQLRLIEDSLLVYTVTRAPERRVFYIGTGNLNKSRSEEFVSKLMARMKNRVTFDGQTGEVSQRKNVVSMIEDIWLPRSADDSKNTEVTTLEGGRNFLEFKEYIDLFRKRLLKALRVPMSRFDDDSNVSVMFDRQSEMTREELRYEKRNDKLKLKFSEVFSDALKHDCILKNILDESDWNDRIVNNITFDWNADSYYAEVKKNEILRMKLGMLRDIEEYNGKYFTRDFVYREIFDMDDNDIKELEAKIQEEKKKYKDDEDEDGSRF